MREEKEGGRVQKGIYKDRVSNVRCERNESWEEEGEKKQKYTESEEWERTRGGRKKHRYSERVEESEE